MTPNTATSGVVHDNKPPRLLVAVSSLILKALLRTRVARRIRPLAILSFTGRHSGRPMSVVVGCHVVDGVATVFTPASWRANFTETTPAVVRHRYHRLRLVGTLTTDPARVADALNQVIGSGTSPRALALHVPDSHTITPADVVATHRGMIQFTAETNPPAS